MPPSPAPRAVSALAALLTAALSTPLLIAQQPASQSAPTRQAVGIVADPPSLDLQYTYRTVGVGRFVYLSGPASQRFSIRVTTSSGDWLKVTPTNGSTPQQLQVSVTPDPINGIRAGFHTAAIVVTNTTNGESLSIPVTLTTVGSPISASPETLSFARPAGSPDPASTVLSIAAAYAIGVTATPDVPWLTVTPRDATAPSLLTVTASAAQLAPGVHTGRINFTSFPSVSLQVPVTFTVAPPGPVFSIPTLGFLHTSGNPPPAAQAIDLTSDGAPFRFTLATADAGRNWLTATVNTSTTPARLTVTANPAGLPYGVFRGTITVTPAAGPPRVLDVVLTITAPPAPEISALIHGATLRATAISPGLIFSLFGAGLGPPNGLAATLTSAGRLPTSLDGIRVLFDGVPAPLLYVRGDQLNGIVPYAVAAKSSTQLRVESKGTLSLAREFRVAPAVPGLFTLSATGTGQAAALNQDGTVNGPASPEQSGRAVILYGTGEGLLDAPTEDGLIAGATLRRPLLPVTATVGGVPVEVLYAGSAPGLVAGVLQLNLLLNENVPKGPAVPVEIRVGDNPTAPGVTVAVR